MPPDPPRVSCFAAKLLSAPTVYFSQSTITVPISWPDHYFSTRSGPERHYPNTVCVHIKQSKTDPFKQGAHIYLGRTYQQICTFKAVVSYLAVQRNNPGPVFTFCDGRMLTRDTFGSELDKILRKLDLKIHHYNTHSFRIGAATSTKQAGISYVQIKSFGRWKSDAYLRYIRTPPQQLANLSRLLLPKPSEHNNHKI